MGPFVDGWTKRDVETVIDRGVTENLLYVPIVVSMDPPDCTWSQEICIALSAHPDFNVRGNAMLGFGHLARTCRELNLERVLPIIAAGILDSHEYVRGQATDAADHIKHYLGTGDSRIEI